MLLWLRQSYLGDTGSFPYSEDQLSLHEGTQGRVMLTVMVVVAVAEEPELTLSYNFEHFKAKNSSSHLL